MKKKNFKKAALATLVAITVTGCGHGHSSNTGLDKANKSIKSLKEQLAQTVSKEEVKALESKLQTAESELAKAQEQLKNAVSKEEVAKAEAALASANEELAQVKEELTDAKKDLIKAKEEAEEKAAELAQKAEADLKKAEEKAKALQEEVEKAQGKAQELESEANQAAKKAEEAAKKAEEAQKNANLTAEEKKQAIADAEEAKRLAKEKQEAAKKALEAKADAEKAKNDAEKAKADAEKAKKDAEAAKAAAEAEAEKAKEDKTAAEKAKEAKEEELRKERRPKEFAKKDWKVTDTYSDDTKPGTWRGDVEALFNEEFAINSVFTEKTKDAEGTGMLTYVGSDLTADVAGNVNLSIKRYDLDFSKIADAYIQNPTQSTYDTTHTLMYAGQATDTSIVPLAELKEYKQFKEGDVTYTGKSFITVLNVEKMEESTPHKKPNGWTDFGRLEPKTTVQDYNSLKNSDKFGDVTMTVNLQTQKISGNIKFENDKINVKLNEADISPVANKLKFTGNVELTRGNDAWSPYAQESASGNYSGEFMGVYAEELAGKFKVNNDYTVNGETFTQAEQDGGQTFTEYEKYGAIKGVFNASHKTSAKKKYTKE